MMNISRETAVSRMLIIWVLIWSPIAILLEIQSIMGKYGDDSSAAWNWVIVQVVPVMGLLLAAKFSNAEASWKQVNADRVRWNLALYTSIAQCAFMLIILLIEPFLELSPFKLFDLTAAPLSIWQGIVVACVAGVVFDGR